MKTILVVAQISTSSGMTKLKHIKFNRDKHSIVAGRLTNKHGKDLGQINRVYSE